MRARFTQSFKIQAVEKALERANDVSVQSIADDLGVGHSTLSKWIALTRKQKLEPDNEVPRMTKEKRPQDWSAEEKLNMVITCSSLDDEKVSELCRERGVFSHHIKQWKQEFVSGQPANTTVSTRADNKTLRQENKALKKELNRKDKALAETAALLVLQKKVNEIWGRDEGDSQ
ncbi:Mobile element protein [hydrothermal vent metagenome]|uniref:Mobile element protein n=1 Tax=hydrothermal vent metagenome TaxID=652676 RepID=A0A3B0WJ40_9ZZZZ